MPFVMLRLDVKLLEKKSTQRAKSRYLKDSYSDLADAVDAMPKV